MSARWILHLAALLAPLAAASLWCLRMPDASGSVVWRQFLIFGGIGVVSAQLAALLRWRALERRAHAGRGAWLTGIGMAAITHVLFGVVGVALLMGGIAGWDSSTGQGSGSTFVLQALFFVAISIFAVGAITFPATALLTHWVANLRRKELAHVSK